MPDYMDKHVRQYRLIRYISFELLLITTLIILPYAFAKLWYLVAVLGSEGIIVSLNLWFLNSSKNTTYCAHVLILAVLFAITSANYLVWGIGSTYSLWFYLVPLLAASLVGWRGVVLYSAFSMLMIIAFGSLSIPPFYHLSPKHLLIIRWINHLFAYVIMVTTVIHLLYENRRYEQMLHDKNHILQLEKEKYQYLARFDQLTNLPNRQYFQQHLQEIIDSLAPDYCATVFFMDLDSLKQINDEYGHEVGDHLLLQSARRLQACFRAGDFIARLGGDEFTAVVLHTPDEKIPQVIAKRIIRAFKQAFSLENIQCYSAISIGLCTYPEHTQTAKELIVRADQAMYRAKKIKGSAYSYCD